MSAKITGFIMRIYNINYICRKIYGLSYNAISPTIIIIPPTQKSQYHFKKFMAVFPSAPVKPP